MTCQLSINFTRKQIEPTKYAILIKNKIFFFANSYQNQETISET